MWCSQLTNRLLALCVFNIRKAGRPWLKVSSVRTLLKNPLEEISLNATGSWLNWNMETMQVPKDTSFQNETLRCKSEKYPCWGKDGRESLVWHWLGLNMSLLTTHRFWGRAWKCQGLWGQQQMRKKLPEDQFTNAQRDDKPDSFLLCLAIILCSLTNRGGCLMNTLNIPTM